MLFDLLFPFRARADLSILPDINYPLAQISLHFLEQSFVFIGIAIEDGT
jgi:hypothetical protein